MIVPKRIIVTRIHRGDEGFSNGQCEKAHSRRLVAVAMPLEKRLVVCEVLERIDGRGAVLDQRHRERRAARSVVAADTRTAQKIYVRERSEERRVGKECR